MTLAEGPAAHQPLLTYLPLAGTASLWWPVSDPDPSVLLETALAPFVALEGVVQTLALRLWLAARPAGEPFLDRSVRLERPMWYLAEEVAPGQTPSAPPPGRPFEMRTAPRLSGAAIRRWAETALAQPAPTGQVVVTLETLVADDQRALLQRPTSAQACRVEVGDVTLARPLHADQSGASISFPLPGLDVFPPVRVRVSNEGDALLADLAVSWAPWATEGAPESDAVLAAVSRLTGQGWHVDTAEGFLTKA